MKTKTKRGGASFAVATLDVAEIAKGKPNGEPFTVALTPSDAFVEAKMLRFETLLSVLKGELKKRHIKFLRKHVRKIILEATEI